MKEGRYVKATDVDHIVPHRGDKKLFWDESNWQALCHSHHSIKTRNEDQTPEYHF
jgi:5-methylcytosine-specific restriction protein A